MFGGGSLKYFIYLLMGHMSFWTVTEAKFQFVLLPEGFHIHHKTIEVMTYVNSLEKCAKFLTATTIVLQYNPTSDLCRTFSAIYSYDLRVTESVYYVKMPGKCGKCATMSEAKSAVANYVYKNNGCSSPVFTYDNATRYCVTNPGPPYAETGPSSFYGSLHQGYFQNATFLTKSRALAMMASTVSCQYANATTAMFNDVWYCYTAFRITSPNGNHVLNNDCSKWVTNGTVIKFVHGAEIGYVGFHGRGTVYTAIYLPMGAPANASGYRYIDGSPLPDYLKWGSGYPKGRRFGVIWGARTLIDADESDMKWIICRSPATVVP